MVDVIHKDNPEQAAKGKEVIETCAKQREYIIYDLKKKLQLKYFE